MTIKEEKTHPKISHYLKKTLFSTEKKSEVFSHEFSENGKNKAKTNFQRIKINLGHVLTNVRTISGRSTFEKSPDFQQMKEEQPIQQNIFRN